MSQDLQSKEEDASYRDTHLSSITCKEEEAISISYACK